MKEKFRIYDHIFCRGENDPQSRWKEVKGKPSPLSRININSIQFVSNQLTIKVWIM